MATKTVSILTAGTNNHTESSTNANAFASDFVGTGFVGALTNTAGVAPATGSYAVNAQGTPNMTVAVSAGTAYAPVTPSSQASQRVRIDMTASENVTIPANASGGTRYDWIYISIDSTLAANPDVTATTVATLLNSWSTSTTTDTGTPPTYGLLIAIVTVANGAASISNANITDKRQQTSALSGAIIPAVVASSVNQIKATPAVTGSHPALKAFGLDTNVSLLLQGQGTGAVLLPAASIVGNTVMGSQSPITSTTYTDVTSTSVTVFAPVASYLYIWLSADTQVNTNDTLYLSLNLDGAVTGTAVYFANPTATTFHVPLGAVRRLTLSAGSHTVKVQTKQVSGSFTNCAVNDVQWYGILVAQ